MSRSRSKFLPSKKFSIVLGVLALGGILFFVGKNHAPSFKRANSVSNIKASDFAQIDTDKDGLYDWEESLWGTNPKVADTDANGKSDKEEIDARKKDLGLDTKETDTAALSETERLSRELFTLVVALNDKGALDDEAVKNISDTFSSEIANNREIPDPLPNPEIKTVADNPTNKSAYISSVRALTTIAEKGDMGKEFSVISKSLVEEDESLILGLDKISDTYKNFALSMLAINVPESAKDNHIVLARESLRTAIAIKNLENFYTNPVIGMAGLVQYSNYSHEFQKGLFALNSYFQTP